MKALQARRAEAQALIDEMNTLRRGRMKVFRGIPIYNLTSLRDLITTIILFAISTTFVTLWFATDYLDTIIPSEWRNSKGSTPMIIVGYIVMLCISFDDASSTSFFCTRSFICKLERQLARMQVIESCVNPDYQPPKKNRMLI